MGRITTCSLVKKNTAVAKHPSEVSSKILFNRAWGGKCFSSKKPMKRVKFSLEKLDFNDRRNVLYYADGERNRMHREDTPDCFQRYYPCVFDIGIFLGKVMVKTPFGKRYEHDEEYPVYLFSTANNNIVKILEYTGSNIIDGRYEQNVHSYILKQCEENKAIGQDTFVKLAIDHICDSNFLVAIKALSMFDRDTVQRRLLTPEQFEKMMDTRRYED
jgi:hypothetical protein